MKHYNLCFPYKILCLALILQSCSGSVITKNESQVFSVNGSELIKDNTAVVYKGVNAMQTFGLADPELMDTWNISIVREFIDNLGEQPISGNPILGSNNVWYHSLQNIVNQNREHHKITILCPFGWVDTDGNRILFTGLNPKAQSFFDAYKTKMQRIAEHFKNQPDVWIEVWNEPYHWNNENNYSHELWLDDMTEMVTNLRNIPDFKNIIVVPGNAQGQSETAILAKGQDLLNINFNVIFDLHAYEKWLVNTTEQQITDRIYTLKNNGFAFIFGEVGVQNIGAVMPIQHFLNAAQNAKISTMAWLWNLNTEDNNALLTNEGLPNATVTNNFWGETFKDFLKL